MGRYKVAPFGYECPYRYSCPHMGGLSARGAMRTYQEASMQQSRYWVMRDQYEERVRELIKEVQRLEQENAELTARVQALHRKQFKAKRPPRRQTGVPSEAQRQGSEGPGVASKKKRGAPKGHPGWSRPEPDHIDKIVDVPAPEICPHCACDELLACDEIKEHLQEDIVLQPRTVVTNFRHEQAFCPRCRRPVSQPAEGELPGCSIGPTTKAAAVFLRFGMNLTYRKVADLFDLFFGMRFVPASAMSFDRQATRRGEPLYEDLRKKLRAASVVHADETHWRQDGRSAYVWYAGNDELAVFHIDPSRSSEVAVELLGDGFQGQLVADGYAAYNAVNAQARQSCLAHLIRKAEDVKTEILLAPPKHQDAKAIRFCHRLALIFRITCALAARFAAGVLSAPLAQEARERLYALTARICSDAIDHPKAESFRQRVLDPKREYDRLFVCLTDPDVPATNNHAEQALRTLVIFRKVCFGTRSVEGARSHSVMPSLIDTAQRQGQHPLNFIETLFTADTATAQAALYNAPIPDQPP